MRKLIKNIAVVIVAIFGINSIVISQCEVFDFYDDLVLEPYWYACSGGDYTLNLYSPNDWTDYTIDWGDGSSLEIGTNWISPITISHNYSAAVQNFDIIITNPVLGCSISGVLVMEEATNPSIVIPTGVLTQACAPHPLSFSNQSSNVSANTIFTWDFGDGSTNLVLDQTNLGQVISHTYEENTVDCNTEVTLFAENYCNTIQGGAFFNTFSPVQIYDSDNAAITSSTTVLCLPDNEVTYTNATSRNCFSQGNIEQRYEYWNFGDYWGNGQDSIVDWSPWPPANPYTIQYPGNLGDSYEVMMIDSNFCGLDTAYMTVTIVSPPIADITIVDNEICLGEYITIEQNATGNPNSFSWNFGDGLGWYPTGSSDIVYSYSAPGTYTIAGAVGIESSAACADTAFASVTIVPSPVISILADNLSGCGNVSANFQESSTNADNWDWDFGNGNTFNGSTPPTQNYNTPGDFVVDLSATNSAGCINTAQEIVSVFNSPVVDFIADNVCEGTLAQFTDISTSDGGDPIISWAWDFGDSFTSTEENPVHQFALSGTYNITLSVSTINCNAALTTELTVESAPVPIFSPDLNSGCSPLGVTFSNSSIDSDSYAWDFGDQSGSFMEEPVHTFYNFTNSDTIYTVILIASSDFGCYQNDSLDITVSPGAQAAFTDNAQPPGCAPFMAVFNNASSGATSYEWDFGDGSSTDTSENPTHIYGNNTGFIQTYSVQLIAYSSNGCNDTIVSALTVYPQP
ncbi:MAG: PKD domain-containing protein, partial [Flavobacteriales bacterium]